jgi:signal transduction histidine kinase
MIGAEWMNSPSIVSTATLTASVILPSAPGDRLNMAHLEHRLLHLLPTQSTSDAVFQCAQAIGETFRVDCCFIVPQSQAAPSSRYIYFSPACFSEGRTTGLNSSSLQAALAPLGVKLDATEPIAVNQIEVNQLEANQSKSDSVARSSEVDRLSWVRAALVLPIPFQGQINGRLVLLRSHPDCWQDTEIQQLQTLLPYVAVILSHVNLEQQIQQQAHHQDLINQLTTAIRNSWELDRIFKLAVEGSATALQVSRGMIFLLKYADPLYKSRSQNCPTAKANIVADWIAPYLTVESNLNSDSNSAQEQTFWASSCSLCQRILTNGDSLALSGLPIPFKEWADSSPAGAFALDRFPALLLVPLENQGTVLGCLVLQHHQARNWASENISFAKLIAAQLSTAIIQVRTLQHVQTLVQERTAQLQRSLEVQAKLYEKTRQQVEQLRQLHEEREEFLSSISHELRTPLTSMTLAIRMLRQADLSPERQTKYLDILEQQCVQETQLINDLLALRKLETNTTTAQLQKLDVRYLIRDTAQSIAESLAEQNLTLALDLPPTPLTLYTEPDSLCRILTELLTNARKYSDADTVIRLAVRHCPTTQQVDISLENVGASILPSELPHIFDKFRRGQGVTQQAIQGTGLGLALVKQLVEYLGGTIEVFSQPIANCTSWRTCFTVHFPQFPEEAVHPIS